MLSILKQDKNTVFEYDYPVTTRKKDEYYSSALPKPFTNKDQISYNEWLDMFSTEIDNIVSDYIEIVTSALMNEGYQCSMNIEEIKKNLAHLFYKSSYSRYKYYKKLIK